jgi:hypothetical protein
MHRSSETIGAIAAALAKAQAELTNPDKTLSGTISVNGGERTFRYASLATGLELVRKSLGRQEIAVVQTTAVDQGQIMLTTLLVHASGEWVSSLWPVCGVAEASAHIKGAALTYARRYALFTLVGIAGEDDLDAPELAFPSEPSNPAPLPRKGAGNGSLKAPRLLAVEASAELRERLLGEISPIDNDDALALWAHRSLPLKNTLTQIDAQAVEAAYVAQLASCAEAQPVAQPTEVASQQAESEPAAVTPIPKPGRKRSKAHLAFVAAQPCLVCRARPCDAHHLKIARPRALGRKVSDEFTVPLCRQHHRELHRHGHEANWWANLQIAPMPIARGLWEASPVNATSDNGRGPDSFGPHPLLEQG